MLTTLTGMVAALGPFALAGGPIGIGVAWLGSMAANKTVKFVAIGAGLVLLVSVSVGLTIHIQHLERDSAALKQLSAETRSLEQRYGCDRRIQAEMELAACLTARDRDAEAAKAQEIARERLEAARAQEQLDRDNAAAEAASAAEQAAIQAAPATADGPVPKVLLDSWARKRKARGLK